MDQLFFLTPENISLAAHQIDTYLIFGIELSKTTYSRSELANITRELNKVFPRPVLILFKHAQTLTLSVINRRINKKEADKDVLEKVTLIKDIRLENTHRTHLEILNDLVYSQLKLKPNASLDDLDRAWQKVLDTKTLNNQFYKKLFDWYLFALPQINFPQIRSENDFIPNEQHQSESLELLRGKRQLFLK